MATTEVSFADVGDEVVALRFVATELDPDLQGITFSSDQIYIRTSNYVISQGQSVNGGLAAAPGDPKLNETYAKVALSKLGVAIQQAKQAAKAEKKAD